jgi:hypothetical protein
MADCVTSNYVSEVSLDGVTVADIIGYNYSIGQERIPLQVQQGRFLRSPRNLGTASSGSGSRRSAGLRRSGGSPSAWSEWEWSDQYGKWVRYRLLADGNYEYEYQEASSS